MKSFVKFGVLLYVFVFFVSPEINPVPQGAGDIRQAIAAHQLEQGWSITKVARLED